MNGKCALVLAAWLSGCSALPNESSTFQALFSNPVCGEYRYSIPITQNDGTIRTHKFGNAFCTKRDLQTIKQGGDIQRRVQEVLNDRTFDLERVDVASYIFFDGDLADRLCKRFAVDSFDMRFFVQHTSADDSLVSRPLMLLLQQCLGERFQSVEVGCDVFTSHECPKRAANTMHTKLLIFKGDKNGRTRAVIFGGSGNLADRLKIHTDDMLYMDVPIGSPLDTKHRCMLDAMRDVANRPSSVNIIRQNYRACIKPHDTNRDQGVALYFMPAEYKDYVQDLLSSLQAAKSIKIAVQLLGDSDIRDALITAAARGADVQVLLDNVWYYVNLASSLKPYERDWGKKDVALFFTHLQPIVQSKARIHFLETNAEPGVAIQNYVHLRYVIVDHTKVFTGSGHMKSGAFRFNYENQYIVTDKSLVRAYEDNFDNLWNRSVPISRMPKAYVPARIND